MYFRAYVLPKLAKKEIKSEVDIPFKEKLRMWRNGFFSASYVLYDLGKNDLKDYLSDYQENIKAVRLNKDNAYLLDNKIRFYDLIKGDLQAPADIGLLKDGEIHSSKGRTKSVSDLKDLLENGKILLLKPVDSASGMGVLKVSKEGDNIICNNEKISMDEFLKKISTLNNYIVSFFIQQASYSSKIYPEAVSTVRILTMISPETGKPFIAAAAHRFATDKSFPVDNCNAGGLTANINIGSGRLSKAVSPYFKGSSITWYKNHPDTGESIEGVQIPHWEEIKSKILNAAGKISQLKYIGWDIVVTDDGFIVLEGNDGPDIKLHQVHSPLLINPDVRNFFRFYGVVK